MGETPQPEGVAVERVVSLQPAAWLYQVRFTGEDGRQATDWHNYGVYQSKADAEHAPATGLGAVWCHCTTPKYSRRGLTLNTNGASTETTLLQC